VIAVGSDGVRRKPQPLQNLESRAFSVEQAGHGVIRGA
jgi:hypothetical protein